MQQQPEKQEPWWGEALRDHLIIEERISAPPPVSAPRPVVRRPIHRPNTFLVSTVLLRIATLCLVAAIGTGVLFTRIPEVTWSLGRSSLSAAGSALDSFSLPSSMWSLLCFGRCDNAESVPTTQPTRLSPFPRVGQQMPQSYIASSTTAASSARADGGRGSRIQLLHHKSYELLNG